MLSDCFSAELTRRVAGTSLRSQGTVQMRGHGRHGAAQSGPAVAEKAQPHSVAEGALAHLITARGCRWPGEWAGIASRFAELCSQMAP